ncbi:hypothetical protein FA13DRAFT_1794624 [Coprinellus micaceus]|uniref:Uncharacterized protein n=1 Tax=Coprinellus micaceus TaxID=71717 RepID=A0A4Y7T2C0_COPMI|nr:hypothetical protein FA13DRAFT_1794624 [Coprinellus micaceus]
MGTKPHRSMALNDPVLAAKDYINTLLREAASDLRTNNRDLRLILGIMEKDVARLQTSLEHLEKRNEQLEELLDLQDNDTNQSACPRVARNKDSLPSTVTTGAFPLKPPKSNQLRGRRSSVKAHEVRGD